MEAYTTLTNAILLKLFFLYYLCLYVHPTLSDAIMLILFMLIHPTLTNGIYFTIDDRYCLCVFLPKIKMQCNWIENERLHIKVASPTISYTFLQNPKVLSRPKTYFRSHLRAFHSPFHTAVFI